MSTVISRIETKVNTRPLTKVSTTDLLEIAMKPIDFLQGNLRYSMSDTPLQMAMVMCHTILTWSKLLRNRKKHCCSRIATAFSEPNYEYLTSPRDSRRISLQQPRHVTNVPQVCEIVLVEQELLPQTNWVYGKVTELITSADGLNRSTKILMPNQRAVQRPLNE